MRVARALVALCTFSVFLPAESAVAGTSLALRFRGAEGEPAQVTRAALRVTAWGVSEEHPLPAEGDVVKLDLDTTRLEWADRFGDTRGFVYVEAEGYAPLISEPFTWPAPASHSVTIDFRSGRAREVAPGEAAALEVRLRKPATRRIRLVDGAGQAVSGIALEAALTWQAPNHCGFLNRAQVLAAGTTNAEGAVSVPDVDADYGLTLGGPHMVFADASTPYGELVTPLTELETTLRVRRLERRPLLVAVVNAGQPVSGARLWVDMRLGVCGAGYTELAASGADGRIEVSDFYPEEWKGAWLCLGGKQVWIHGGDIPARIDLASSASDAPNALAEVCSEVRQFRPLPVAQVPETLFHLEDTLCEALEPTRCRQEFLERGKAWEGDVDGDGVLELLLKGTAMAGTGGEPMHLLQRRGDSWTGMSEVGGSFLGLSGSPRFDILPLTRDGHRDLRVSAESCLKWNGKAYVPYETSDYRRLSPQWFDAARLDEAELLWDIEHLGESRTKLEPRWFPEVPSWSTAFELEDPELGVRWVAMFKGGVYAVQNGRSYLLLPRPEYGGAEKLELAGDSLIVYVRDSERGDSLRVAARYNRHRRELEIVPKESASRPSP